MFKYLTNITRSTIFPRDMATSKRRFVLVFALRLIYLVSRRLWKDKCQRQAAALSYQTFLSMVPLMFLVLTVASFFNIDNYADKVVAFIENNFLPVSAQKVALYVRSTASSIRPGPLGIVGGISFGVIALAMYLSTEQIVNEIYRCKKNRMLLKRIFFFLVLVVLVPVAFSFSIYYSTMLLFFPQVIHVVLPAGITITILFLSYQFLPHRKIKIKYAVVSGVVAGVGLEFLKWGFAEYATYLGRTLSYVYGTMAIVPLFMVWVYFMWILFLFGAELGAALHEVKHYENLNT